MQYLDPDEGGEEHELARLVKADARGSRLLVGAVLALHRHPPPKVKGLEAVGLVAALLQLVQRVDALVVGAASLSRRVAEEAHLQGGEGRG